MKKKESKIRKIMEKYIHILNGEDDFSYEIYRNDLDELEEELEEYCDEEKEKYHKENKPWNCL